VGTRVPHRWLDGRHTRSTLDLGGPGWALVVAGEPAQWARAADAAPVALPVHRVEADFLAAEQAVLLRPDDVVAWRGEEVTAPPRVLHEILQAAGTECEIGGCA
jgi:hypothetical protein